MQCSETAWICRSKMSGTLAKVSGAGASVQLTAIAEVNGSLVKLNG